MTETKCDDSRYPRCARLQTEPYVADHLAAQFWHYMENCKGTIIKSVEFVFFANEGRLSVYRKKHEMFPAHGERRRSFHFSLPWDSSYYNLSATLPDRAERLSEGPKTFTFSRNELPPSLSSKCSRDTPHPASTKMLKIEVRIPD